MLIYLYLVKYSESLKDRIYVRGKSLNEDLSVTILNNPKQEGANETTEELPRGAKARVANKNCVSSAQSKMVDK